MLSDCFAASLPRCLAASLPRCLAASLPRCRAWAWCLSLPRCLAASLLRCLLLSRVLLVCVTLCSRCLAVSLPVQPAEGLGKSCAPESRCSGFRTLVGPGPGSLRCTQRAACAYGGCLLAGVRSARRQIGHLHEGTSALLCASGAPHSWICLIVSLSHCLVVSAFDAGGRRE